MVVAVWLMGVGTLKDLALVQLIGVVEGTFSSIFLATPFLVSLKSRQAKIRKHDAAVLRARGQVAGEEPGDLVDASVDVVEESEKRHVSLAQDPDAGLTWRP